MTTCVLAITIVESIHLMLLIYFDTGVSILLELSACRVTLSLDCSLLISNLIIILKYLLEFVSLPRFSEHHILVIILHRFTIR
jgi:hypothetical protein